MLGTWGVWTDAGLLLAETRAHEDACSIDRVRMHTRSGWFALGP